METYVWVIFWHILVIVAFYRLGFRKGKGVGYTKGAEDVLEEWKHYMITMEDD